MTLMSIFFVYATSEAHAKILNRRISGRRSSSVWRCKRGDRAVVKPPLFRSVKVVLQPRDGRLGGQYVVLKIRVLCSANESVSAERIWLGMRGGRKTWLM